MTLPSGVPLNLEHLGIWKPWTPQEVAERLRTVDVPWCVVGGWALDLWRGAQTRPHEDIEISIPRRCFPVMRNHLCAFELFSVGDGEVHALSASGIPPADRHQNWVLDEAETAWRLDIFLEPGNADIWVFRRDETISAPRSNIVAITKGGVPYLKPEAVLLFKAKLRREKDEADFAACVPLMEPGARQWLKEALSRAHPGHAWLAGLD